jgi:energy-coupling factor transport system ATP-binding protein
VRGLRLRYSETGEVVLRGVDLTLRQGEIKLLLGPSGSGKSSLALTLNGLIPHQLDADIRGSVAVDGRDTTEVDVPWLTTKVGMLFQDPESQLATLTVVDEVAFGMENLRVPPEEMRPRIEAALHRVGLDGLEERDTSALSGGQKQRLALASTLAMGVEVLVLDEPTANLDPEGTADFFELLRELKQAGTTVLIIEHKLDELITQVDTIAVLGEEGTIVADGPPRDVLHDNRALLTRLGVWVPQVSDLANRLAACGLTLNPYPLTVKEAAQALQSVLPTDMGRAPADGKAAADLRDTSNTKPLIEVRGLSYHYPQGAQALRGVNLTVQRGEFYALLGPNGSGKSTLAHHLIGLKKPPKGTVFLGGQDVARMSPADIGRAVGYVFQNPEHQFVALTVSDELAFSLRANKVPESEIEPRVTALLREFGLEEQADSNPYQLSQGQKRRLSVATMLAVDPAVLILDEPTFGQDMENAERISKHLERLNKAGTTVMVITHDMKLVGECAHRVGVLVAGETAFEGSPRELFSRVDLLERARLAPPPLFELSRKLAAERPGFPLLMSVDEYERELCGSSGTSRATASYTG